MRQVGTAAAVQVMDRQNLHNLEKYFISAEIYQRPDVAVRQVDLARIISNEIIPRLLNIHTTILPDAPPVDMVIEALMPDIGDISALAHIVLGDDLPAAAAYVTVLRERGLPVETLYVELLEPTARHLGTMWDNDECDFIDVTLGVGRLQKLLAIFNDTHALPDLGTQRRVLMATAPGNQHFFGAAMIERLLSAAGWQVEVEYSGQTQPLMDMVSRNWFAVAGLTAGSDQQLDDLKAAIAQLRAKSKNTAIGVLVGGQMFTENPELAVAVGADATAPNAPAAVLAAQKLFDCAIRDQRSRLSLV